jgi:hypothetical protein
MRHGNASPPPKGFNTASPKAKPSGTVQLSLRKLMRPVLRGKP